MVQKCKRCGFNLPMHSYLCDRDAPTNDPWSSRAVFVVLMIGLILGYILGIWTPESWFH
jgi:uncharacterized protein (DUF983 family)